LAPRACSVSDFAEITDRKKAPEKPLIVRLKKKSGRNFHGKITAHQRGGGARRLYRVIDFQRTKDGIPARVFSIEYDPTGLAWAPVAFAQNQAACETPPPEFQLTDANRIGARDTHRTERSVASHMIGVDAGIDNVADGQRRQLLDFGGVELAIGGDRLPHSRSRPLRHPL
jgi:hypothetical protein